MSGPHRDHEEYFSSDPNITRISERQVSPPPGKDVRHASAVLESGPTVATKVLDEVTLRDRPNGRTLVKATFLEDSRRIRTLALTQFHSRNNPENKTGVSLTTEEVERLLEFDRNITEAGLVSAGRYEVEGEFRGKSVTEGEARRLFEGAPDLFRKLIENAPLAEDLVAVGYRRAQLEKFERLLTSPDDFAAERSRLSCRPEDVWQKFFEANKWIFGYGLSYQFVSSLDERKLEQVVRGWSLAGAGKRADGLLKTRGVLSSLCLVEIKRHDTPLLVDTAPRSDTWPPSNDLTEAVAQVHATAHAAMETYRDKLSLTRNNGDPTEEVLYNFAPRSFLVIGSLDQFMTSQGVNEIKLRAFELYRRNIWRPEIITFDELLDRARFIVEQA